VSRRAVTPAAACSPAAYSSDTDAFQNPVSLIAAALQFGWGAPKNRQFRRILQISRLEDALSPVIHLGEGLQKLHACMQQ
jgi:hypothetical protein